MFFYRAYSTVQYERNAFSVIIHSMIICFRNKYGLTKIASKSVMAKTY